MRQGTKQAFVAGYEGQPVEEVLAAAKRAKVKLTRKQVHRIRFVLRQKAASEAPAKKPKRGVTKRTMQKQIKRAEAMLANHPDVVAVNGGPLAPSVANDASESFRSDACNLCGHRRDQHRAGVGCLECGMEQHPAYVPSHTFYKRDAAGDKRAQLRALILDLGLDVAHSVIQDLGASGSS